MKTSPAEVLQTVLLAKGNGVKLNAETEALIGRFLARNMASLEEEERLEKRQREEAAQSIKEMIEIRKRVRRECPHLKEDGKSALFGQRLNNGQECFVCLKCTSDFFNPPKKELGQFAPPPHLTGNRGIMGAQMNI